MLFATSNLVHESVVLTTRDTMSFVLYVFNQTESHFTNICSASFNEEILDLAVSEVSENASRYIAVIVTKRAFYIINGSSNGSILFEKNIQHHIKNLYNVTSIYIPLHRLVVCFCNNTICVFNPYEEDISITQTFLKLDVSKRLQYRPLQQDQRSTHDIMVSLNNGSNIFILEKSLISGCHSLQCCEVTESGDVLVWWDADISSSHVSIARTIVYNAEDAVLVATGDDVRVYTVDGLLCRLSLKSNLSLRMSGVEDADTDTDTDIITAVQGVQVQSPADSSLLLQGAPFVDQLHFLVATFQSGLLLCSVLLPDDESTLDVAPVLTSIIATRFHISYDSFSFRSSSFPSQIVADDTNAFDSRHHSFLPYFDSISILQLSVNLAESREEGHLVVKNSAYGVQMVRVSLSPFGDLQQEQQQEQEEKEEKGDGSGGRHSSLGMSCSMFGVLDAFCQVDKILPLTDSAAPGADTGIDIDTSICLQYATDGNYPLDLSEAALALARPHHYSSMLYRVEHGTPLLSESSNMYPLEVTQLSQPLRIFTVVSDIPLDIIPITQRSYSNNWSTIVIMSSVSLSESSLFSINHAGKFQAVMEKTDVIYTEPTLAFFRIRRQLLIQVTKSTLNLLQLKNCRYPTAESSTNLLVSSLSFPHGSTIQHVAFQSAALWTKGRESGGGASSKNIFNKRSHYNASVFVVSSRNKLIVIQLVETKTKLEKKSHDKNKSETDEKEYPCSMHEVFSHTMGSDILALSISEDSEEEKEINGEKKLVLAVTHWDSRRSVQVLSLLLSRGSCCVLSVINSSDMQLTPPLRDMHTGNEASGALPFQFVQICPTLGPHDPIKREQRCYVVGGCVDGNLIIFEYKYLHDSCVWKEIQQWSSFVKGGIQDVLPLNFFNKEQFNFESLLTTTSSNRRHQRGELKGKADDNALHVSAFIVNGRDGDFVYRFRLSSTEEMKESSQISSDIHFTRSLRQSKHRSQICAVHPLYLSRSELGTGVGAGAGSGSSQVQKEHSETIIDNEHVYVDNFLWLVSTREDEYTSSATTTTSQRACDHPSLCIGSKSIYHGTSLAAVTVATKCRRLSFRILDMIFLNNPTSSQGTGSGGSGKAYVLIMYSQRCPSRFSSECPDIRTGVQIIDCESLCPLWEYSPDVQRDIESSALHSQVENSVTAIALAPGVSARQAFPSVQQGSDGPVLFSFLVLHSYRRHTHSDHQAHETAGKRRVMCSLFHGVESCDKDKEKLNVQLVHTLQLTKTFLQNNCSLPFLMQPVGLAHVAIASEQGVAVLGWRCEEAEVGADTAVVCSLVEVAAASYSLSEKDRPVVSNVSVQRHFESTVVLPSSSFSSVKSGVGVLGMTRSKPSILNAEKMLQLSPALFSSSNLSFSIYVALANVGIDIFEFSCQNSTLVRSGFINAEGLLLTNVLHSVSRPMAEIETVTQGASSQDSAGDISTPVTNSDSRNNSSDGGINVDNVSSSSASSEEENKFKGSLLCVDRHTGNVLLYDSRQRWVKQPQEQEQKQGQDGRGTPVSATETVSATPVLLSPHHCHRLLSNEVKASYVAFQSLMVSEFSVRDSTGRAYTYQVEK